MLDCVEFIVRRSALACPADRHFSQRKHCLSVSMVTNTPLSWQLSKAFCQMTLAPWPVCQTRGLFGLVYLSQQRRPLHSCSQCSGPSGKEKKSRKLCLCNFISFSERVLWSGHVKPDWTHHNRGCKRTWTLLFGTVYTCMRVKIRMCLNILIQYK